MAFESLRLVNLGTSCFINAGIQALLAAPQLPESIQRGASAAERALRNVIALAGSSPTAFVPRALTELYYHNRQEDCSEFVLGLLHACGSCHGIFAGQEQPRLRCRHCGYSRTLPAERFLSLQLPLMTERRIRSVQEALDAYVTAEYIQEGIDDWCCLSDECFDAGVVMDAPIHQTQISNWSEALMLCLKRWDSTHGLLDHEVYCNGTVTAAGQTYRLQALVTHIGDNAMAGHYVSYRACRDGFRKFDDNHITPSTRNDGYFVTLPGEKVYMLVYTKASSDSDDSDSDVIVVRDTDQQAAETSSSQQKRKQPETSGDGDKQRPKRLQNFCNYAAEDRRQIAEVLRKSVTLQDAIDALHQQVPDFTTLDTTSSTYLSRRLLRSWLSNHSALEKALSTACKSDLPAPKKENKKKITRRSGSACANLGQDASSKVNAALEIATSTGHFEDTLTQTLPGFSSTEATAQHYIPRATLHRWFVSTSQISPPDTWADEHGRHFTIACDKPAKRSTVPVSEMDESSVWLLHGSWTFCPHCGRHRPQTRMQGLSVKHSSAVPCFPSCDRDAADLLAPRQSQVTMANKLEGYVVPRADHWRSWSNHIGNGELRLADLLSEAELRDLAVLHINVEFRSRRGGKANITSKQKRTVVRCTWRPTSLLSLRRNNQAARAFTWLMQHNATYASYVHRHEQMMESHREDEAWREVPTAELLLNMPGVEVAARPWLYPLASYAETDLAQRLSALGWIASTQKPSVRAAFLRKLTGRCIDYARDFPLQCLLYDVCMAKTITSVMSVAHQQNVARNESPRTWTCSKATGCNSSRKWKTYAGRSMRDPTA